MTALTTIVFSDKKAARTRMNKGSEPLLFCIETCAQPTRNGLKSGFLGIGHSSKFSVVNMIIFENIEILI
jgi:hypothetical protein